MGYFLCLKKCFKKYLLYRGYVLEGTAGKYLIPLAVTSKPREIQTFVNGASILANNNQYDSKGRLIETDYEGIYKTRKSEYFIVTQEGQEAVLKVISRDEALKLWHEMPHKLIKNKDVFCDPREVKERNIRDILEEAERTRPQREHEERVREAKKKPYWWIENPWLDDECAEIIR